MGNMSIGALKGLLATHVVEVVFTRRRSKYARPLHRRMLCSNCRLLLDTIEGKIALGFRPPTGVGLPYDPNSKNLVVAWDIFMQDYRQIPIESATVLSSMPIKSEEDLTNFWEYFNQTLSKMSPSDKLQYMDR